MAQDGVVNGVPIEGEDPTDNFYDIDSTTARASDLYKKIETVEYEKKDLMDKNEELKDKLSKLTVEVEGLRKEKDKLEEELKSNTRALESIASRAGDLETEVSRLQHDLISAENDGREANAELLEVKRALEEKVASLKRIESEKEELKNEFLKEIEQVKAAKAAIEAKVVEMESKIKGIGVDAKERIDEKEREFSGFKKGKEELEAVAASNALDLEKSRAEKKEAEEALRVSEGKVKVLEKKLIEFEKAAEEAEKVISGLKEKTVEAINGTTKVDRDCDALKNLQWPAVVAAAGTSFVLGGLICYLHYGRRSN